MNRLALSFGLLALLVISHPCLAQVGGGGGAGGGGAGGGGGIGGGGAGGGGAGQNSAGIKIDADGIVSIVAFDDGSGLPDKKRRELLAQKNAPQNIDQRSKLRLVSLVQLEKEIGRLLSEEKPITRDLFYLAGLQRIDHVFVFPVEQDVCIAGPAEGFVPDSVGRMVGIESGRPVLRLDDFAIAVRTVSNSKQLGCSIDPEPSRIAALQKFVREGVPASVEEVEARFNEMDDILGLQNVRIDGVPGDSHFATILVEADYRMKRIAGGLDIPPVKGFKSHLAMMGSTGNSMQRWWFVPYYDAISRSPDGLAFRLSGQRAKLLAEEELVDAQGNRSSAQTTKKAIQAFAKHFSEKFPQLAEKLPVFAELQNLMDWSALAALLRKEQIPQRIDWKQELLLDQTRLTFLPFETPKKVPSQVSYKRAGNQIVGLVNGGVVVHPMVDFEISIAAPKDLEKLEKAHSTAMESTRNETHRWWWDAEP